MTRSNNLVPTSSNLVPDEADGGGPNLVPPAPALRGRDEVRAPHRTPPQTHSEPNLVPSLFDDPPVEAPTPRRSPRHTPAGPGVCVCDRERDPGGDWFEQLRKRCDP